MQTKTPDYFYFINKDYIICDLNVSGESDRTFDISFFDLANCEALLNKLGLYYIYGSYGMNYTYESRAKWFGGYLTAFTGDSKKSTLMHQKLMTNPTLRIIITNKELLSNINKIITPKKINVLSCS